MATRRREFDGLAFKIGLFRDPCVGQFKMVLPVDTILLNRPLAHQRIQTLMGGAAFMQMFIHSLLLELHWSALVDLEMLNPMIECGALKCEKCKSQNEHIAAKIGCQASTNASKSDFDSCRLIQQDSDMLYQPYINDFLLNVFAFRRLTTGWQAIDDLNSNQPDYFHLRSLWVITLYKQPVGMLSVALAHISKDNVPSFHKAVIVRHSDRDLTKPLPTHAVILRDFNDMVLKRLKQLPLIPEIEDVSPRKGPIYRIEVATYLPSTNNTLELPATVLELKSLRDLQDALADTCEAILKVYADPELDNFFENLNIRDRFRE
jgi:hypothetical protein